METRKSQLRDCADSLRARVSSFLFLVSSFFSRVSNVAFRFSSALPQFPWRLVVAGTGLVLVALAVGEHDARLRRDYELRQLRRQTAEQIAELRARAQAALEDARSSAQRMQELEARRRRLEREEANLRSQISDLKGKERARVREVAALPLPEIAARLGERLGPEAMLGDSGTEERVSGAGFRVSGKNGEENPDTRDLGPGTRYLIPDT